MKAAKGKKKDVGARYNRFKEFGGKEYTGMTVGRSHKWHYDNGDWRDTKITPDLGEFPMQPLNAGQGMPERFRSIGRD